MKMFLLGVIIMWFICSVAFVFEDDGLWVNEMDWILRFPCYILWKVLCLLFFPSFLFYRIFLRHTIKPVSFEILEVKKIVADSTRLFGNVYFCFDKKAKALVNKCFFFRVDPTFSNPNKPSSPEGNFRIGVDN